MELQRAYGEATRVRFPLVTFGGTDYVSGATFSAGDVLISKDDGTFANTGSTPTEISQGSPITSGYYYLPLTATEMEADNVVILIRDQSSPQIYEDQSMLINTFNMLGGMIEGAVTTSGSNSSSQVRTDLLEVTNDHYNNRIITFTSGVVRGQQSRITDSVGSASPEGVVLIFDALPSAETPAVGVTFRIS